MSPSVKYTVAGSNVENSNNSKTGTTLTRAGLYNIKRIFVSLYGDDLRFLQQPVTIYRFKYNQ